MSSPFVYHDERDQSGVRLQNFCVPSAKPEAEGSMDSMKWVSDVLISTKSSGRCHLVKKHKVDCAFFYLQTYHIHSHIIYIV